MSDDDGEVPEYADINPSHIIQGLDKITRTPITDPTFFFFFINKG